jgi:transcriptional regulator with AAA-type ATPase domain
MLHVNASCGSDTTKREEGGHRRTTSIHFELAIAWIVGSLQPRFQPLHGARLRVGRSKECELRLDHPSVSRQHAELYRQGTTYALRDFDSTNGTWRNGSRVEHAAIQPADVLRIGDCVGIVLKLARGSVVEFGHLAPALCGGPTLGAALAKARAAAASDVPIVLVGETGAGKEQVARALHHWSGRSGPFSAVNCSTVPTLLAEAEFFGHQRGAFTGAERARPGHFQAANGGTLLLDEIADLPPEVQAKLLRAVETGEVTPLGTAVGGCVDVRIIVATQQPLQLLVEQKRFRADLAARLAGFTVHVPPLRSRREEIPCLFQYLLSKHSAGPPPGSTPQLIEWLCLRDWPGNVRELELLVRKLLALHAGEAVLRPCFAEELCAADSSWQSEWSGTRTRGGFRDRRESDLHELEHALERTKGNLTAAAQSVGISRRRAYRLLASAGTVATKGVRSSASSQREAPDGFASLAPERVPE